MSFPTSHACESSSSSYSSQPCRQFTLSEIQLATQNFDDSLVVGRGGFGKVYRGTITCGEKHLDAAIKRLDSGSSQGAVEFWAEIEMLSNLRHHHLVSLIGYCSDGQEMILVYEYMPNGTLADRLHKRLSSLTWVRRLKICLGAARGLDYLHSDTDIKPRVIHRDVKSSNILLDDNWAAKISDFGLSKIGPTNQPATYVNTMVRGTFGYLDPDYFHTGRLTRKSDVYAFGVVLFEVLCGKQAVDRSIDEEQWGLATWAQESIKEGRLKHIVDSTLRGRISPKCSKMFALLAERCLHCPPKQRPTMAEVVVGLESILALQEKMDNHLQDIRFFSRRVPTFLVPSNQENSVGGRSLKSLDTYLFTVGGEDRVVHRFDFNTIVCATENFSEANKIPCNHLKSMYKGRLQNGQDITITQYFNPRTYKEFMIMNEASIIVKFEHENVLQLLGYCIDKTNVYFLHDFALKETLAGLLFDSRCNLLDWNKRYKIILGIAKALVYLHKHAPIPIIHCNVRPACILLDESFDPKLSDFGLALAINETDCIFVENVPGAIGFIAPEVYSSYCYSTKADVFSFGMLVFVTVTWNSVVDLHLLAQDKGLGIEEYVHKICLEGTFTDITDPRIDVDSILMTKFMEIGLLCVQRDAAFRPTMEEVVDMLLGSSVSEMRARIIDSVSRDFPPDLGLCIDDYDTSATEEFISELCPR